MQRKCTSEFASNLVVVEIAVELEQVTTYVVVAVVVGERSVSSWLRFSKHMK
jgi:hypothetical protein